MAADNIGSDASHYFLAREKLKQHIFKVHIDIIINCWFNQSFHSHLAKLRIKNCD